MTTARGFEPLRAEPNGFLVHHLNHSVTLSLMSVYGGAAELFLIYRMVCDWSRWIPKCPHQELNLGCRGHNATS